MPEGEAIELTHEIRWFDSLDSTNRYLLDEARAGAPDGLVAVADFQTAGRGRRGRDWVAPPGASLLASVLLRPALAPERAPVVTMACGVAMAEAIARVAGFTPGLKWPNDLVVNDRKLVGILAEADGRAIVVGAGVNVEWHEFPPELAETATACNLEAGHPVDRRELLNAFLAELDRRYMDLDAVVAEYRTRLVTRGRRVRVERPDGDLGGLAVLGAQLEHERAGHAQQAAGVAGGRADHAVVHDEEVRARRLAQLAGHVEEDRLARAALVRVRERADVLGVRDRLQSRDRAALVPRPRDDRDVDGRRPRLRRGGDDDDGRWTVAPLGAERGGPA